MHADPTWTGDPRVAPIVPAPGWDDTQSRDIPLSLDPAGLKVAVVGLGVSGWAAADVLAQRNADVIAVDNGGTEQVRQHADLLRALGGDPRIGPEHTTSLPRWGDQLPDVVVTSPGWPPHHPVLAEAAEAGVPIWSEVELGWRLRRPGAAPWVCVTGTNGKTTTVRLIAAMLAASGRRVATVGNVGTPLIDAIVADLPFDVVVVELSSFQLHWTSSMAPQVAMCLNVAPDHLDWHGGMAGYAADKGRIFSNTERACIYNTADPATEQMVRDAEVVDGCRAIGFGIGTPTPGSLGVVDDVLCDRAFVEDRQNTATELVTLADVASNSGGVAAPHQVANVLAAAAAVLATGAPATAVRDGLASFTPEPHRCALVVQHDDVRWVDDSKATNAHAAAASLGSAEQIVWIAGGLAKGAEFDDLVAAHAHRLVAVVLIGVDQQAMLQALGRHAPDVLVVQVDSADTSAMSIEEKTRHGQQVMSQAVAHAAKHAPTGSTVLLAPACASMDQFKNYQARGNAFASAVHQLVGEQTS